MSASAPLTFLPDISRPLRFPHDWLRILYWAYFRPFTLERYIKQLDPALGLTSSLFTLWRKRHAHPPLRHLVYLVLSHALITPWLALPLAYALRPLDVTMSLEDVILGILIEGVVLGIMGGVVGWSILWSLMWGVVWGIVWGVMWWVALLLKTILVGVVGMPFALVGVVGVPLAVLGSMVETVLQGVKRGIRWSVMAGVAMGVIIGGSVAMLVGAMVIEEFGVIVGLLAGVPVGIAVALASVSGTLRLYGYPPWFLLAGALGFLDTSGRRLRLSPPFWHEVIVLPLPGVTRQVLALARRDRQAGLAAVNYLAMYRYGWARKVAARAALYVLVDAMAQVRTLSALAQFSRELRPWWQIPQIREQWDNLADFLETVTSKVQAALESDTAQDKTLHLQEALQAVVQWQQRFPTKSLTRRLTPVMATWETLLREAVV